MRSGNDVPSGGFRCYNISVAVMKKNCWEVMGCGREPGGRKAGQLGVCPAATDERLGGLHGGKNAGRACWVVAGTFCEGTVQGTFAQKYQDCRLCSFFRQVKKEEGADYHTSLVILKKLKVLK
jgi:hypothetical protein